jgi:hypothetical protein
MNTTTIIRKSTLSVVLGGLAIATTLGSQAHSASAAGRIDLKASSLYGPANHAIEPGGTFTLNFNGQTTSPSKGGVD